MLSEQTKNVRSRMENKGWIIQMRVFVLSYIKKTFKLKVVSRNGISMNENLPTIFG